MLNLNFSRHFVLEYFVGERENERERAETFNLFFCLCFHEWMNGHLSLVTPRPCEATASLREKGRESGKEDSIGACAVSKVEWDQCDQIGRFYKVFGNNFPIESSPNIFNFLCYFLVRHSCRKNSLVTIWAPIGKFGLFLIPASGHTEWERSR